MTRELSNKEKDWIRKLKSILRTAPKTLSILQSNVDRGLIFYDSESGDVIEDTPEVQGFLEGDPKTKLEYGEDGKLVGWTEEDE